ncbi:unnamed protein product [Anisakis simplex]|uniref:Vesicle-associated membrane protein 711-like n=1 Tax=Anisakis simplex TaxID=6269 RepID=A0A0M3K639_ANISI|nr:unnamed protein product [Anisakis simplex]
MDEADHYETLGSSTGDVSERPPPPADSPGGLPPTPGTSTTLSDKQQSTGTDKELKSFRNNMKSFSAEALRSRNHAQLQCMVVSFTAFWSLLAVLISMIVLAVNKTKLFL